MGMIVISVGDKDAIQMKTTAADIAVIVAEMIVIARREPRDASEESGTMKTSLTMKAVIGRPMAKLGENEGETKPLMTCTEEHRHNDQEAEAVSTICLDEDAPDQTTILTEIGEGGMMMIDKSHRISDQRLQTLKLRQAQGVNSSPPRLSADYR